MTCTLLFMHIYTYIEYKYIYICIYYLPCYTTVNGCTTRKPTTLPAQKLLQNVINKKKKKKTLKRPKEKANAICNFNIPEYI